MGNITINIYWNKTSRLSHAFPLDTSAYSECYPCFLCFMYFFFFMHYVCQGLECNPTQSLRSFYPVPPSFLFSPRCHFCLFFSCLSKRKQFGGLSRCGADSWNFSQPCQGSSTVPVVIQQNPPEMSRRQGENERYLSRHAPRPHASLVHLPDMLEVWYFWMFLNSL